tara:strand:- start:121 stop:504 length:384 start_codon:yes stop_codon:yes gene_type:complete
LNSEVINCKGAKMKKLLVMILSIGLAFPAFSQVDCKGKITNLALHIDNGVLVVGLEGGPDATQLCSVSSQYNGVPPEACKALYSSLLSTKAAGKKSLIRFYEFDTCADSNLNWKASGTLGWSQHMLD